MPDHATYAFSHAIIVLPLLPFGWRSLKTTTALLTLRFALWSQMKESWSWKKVNKTHRIPRPTLFDTKRPSLTLTKRQRKIAVGKVAIYMMPNKLGPELVSMYCCITCIFLGNSPIEIFSDNSSPLLQSVLLRQLRHRMRQQLRQRSPFRTCGLKHEQRTFTSTTNE